MPLTLAALTDSAFDDYYEVVAAARAVDLPDLPPRTKPQLMVKIRYPRPAVAVERFVAYRDDVPVGALNTDMPMADNQHSAQIELWVHPAARRQGVGRELFGRTVDLVRGHGRTLVMGAYCEPLPGGPDRDPAPAAFAASVGVTPALSEVRRRLDIDTVDTGRWQEMYDNSLVQAKGYTLLWWNGHVPDEYLGDVAYLEGRMGTDAPMGDLDYQPENYDAERIRAADEVNKLRGERTYHAAARDDQTGRVVGWTMLEFESGEAAHCWQGTTIVDPDHRGHRLGMLLKLENLIRTREVEPGMRLVDTWNAAENTYMIAINEAVGFRPVDAWVNWQFPVPAH